MTDSVRCAFVQRQVSILIQYMYTKIKCMRKCDTCMPIIRVRSFLIAAAKYTKMTLHRYCKQTIPTAEQTGLTEPATREANHIVQSSCSSTGVWYLTKTELP